MKPFQWILLTIVVGGLGGCDSPNPTVLTERSPSPASQLDTNNLLTLEAKIYQQVNRYRQSRNLPPLTLNQVISQQARLHSQRMAAGLVPFSHDGFEERAKTIGFAIPYQAVAENVAVNQGYENPGAVAVEGWIASPGHQQNMAGDFDTTGIGVARDSQGKVYFTQIFLKQRSSVSSLPFSNPVKSNSLPIILEQETNEQVNQYRLSHNLPPLQLDSQVSYEARLFSQKMASKQAPFSHDGFEERMKVVQSVISLRKMGENLAFMKGYSDPVSEAVRGWINSPGHQKNMVGDYDLTGIGIAKNSEGEYYFTQLFVKKR